MDVRVLGQSFLGLPQIAYEFRGGGPEVLILGGVHGDETEGVAAADGLLKLLLEKYDLPFNLTLVPRFNPDGCLLNTRGNGRGVDLNRNFPTRDWSPEAKTPRYQPGASAGSEPENALLVNFIGQHKPGLIISLHSWHPVLNVNGDCLAVAEVLAKHTGYKIDTDIGYPTPGCLGTYAGLERTSPTITYEIERGQNTAEILKVHPPAIIACLRKFAENP